MRLLAIETATDHLGVAVVDETRLLASYELLAERPHAIELPQAVTRVVQASRCGLGDIDAVAVDIGPGSFTGLRIGLAFVKALVFRMQRPVVGVSSLDVLAAQLAFSSVAVCPLLDAKQRKVYAALYQAKDGTAQKQSDYLLTTIDELITQPQSECPRLGKHLRPWPPVLDDDANHVRQHIGPPPVLPRRREKRSQLAPNQPAKFAMSAPLR